MPKLGVASTTQPRASSCHVSTKSARLHHNLRTDTQSYPYSPQIPHLCWPYLEASSPQIVPSIYLRFTFLIISMSSTREQIATRRKRQRTEADLPLDDPSELQPSKRLKSRTKLHSAAFYDSLSKVWLTRRALKELDRRTSQANSPQRPASTPRRVTRNTSKQIRRFARDGGPELRDLRA